MSIELISILVLVAIFVIATLLPIHMGVLALVAAFIMGTWVIGYELDIVLAGFPADLFMTLVGITYLFALAKDNGTVDLVVHWAVKSVAGRIALIPWVFFTVTGVITAFGAVVPGAVAIIAPMALGFAKRYGIRPLMMGLMVIIGATAGGFSPMSIFGSITNGVVAGAGEEINSQHSPMLLFLGSMVFNIVLGVVAYWMFGGRSLIGKRDHGDGLEDTEGNAIDADGNPVGGTGGRGRTSRASTTAMQTTPVESTHTELATTVTPVRVFTLLGLILLAVLVLAFGQDVGFTSLMIAVVVALISPQSSKGAVGKVAWPTVLLVCGIVTYVSILEEYGTIEWVGNSVAGMNAPLLGGLLICFIGAIVSAFASTTGILGALIPLAVPFLLAGDVSVIGLVVALAISSSVVDSSPFSTSGALVVANSPEEERDKVFKQLIYWGFSMVVIAPIVTWLLLIVPGWQYGG